MPLVSNIIMGGGVAHCTSTDSTKAGALGCTDWSDILRRDPAFAALHLHQVALEPNPAWVQPPYCMDALALQQVQTAPAPLLGGLLREAVVEAAATVWEVRSGFAPIQDAIEQAHQRLAPDTPITPAQWAVLRACLVCPHPRAARLHELRTVVCLQDPHAREIYQRIVDAAAQRSGKARPRIGIITAASDNPFLDADPNVYAFASAGAQAVYVPLHGAMRRCLDANDPAHLDLYYDHWVNSGTESPHWHACAQYPDYAQSQAALAENQGAGLNALLHSLDAVYFSGGDQSRILEALYQCDGDGARTVESPQLRLLRERHDAGTLVVAGTSAGNHIQGGRHWQGRPVPMIAGGDSYPALRNGFSQAFGSGVEVPHQARWYPFGGLGVFRLGVLDSHFSPRSRQGRLVRACADAGMRYGFGIDENTALVVYEPDAQGWIVMEISGEHGVWVADLGQARTTTTPHWAVRGVRAHHLHRHDRLAVDPQGDLHLLLAPKHRVLAAAASPVELHAEQALDYGRGTLEALWRSMGLQGAHTARASTRASQDPRCRQDAPCYQVLARRDDRTRFVQSAHQVGYCHLLLEFAPLEV